MPAAIVLLLRGPKAPHPLHLRGWVYHVLAARYPELHDMPGPKPFSLAVGANGGSAWIRVAFLDDHVARSFSEHVWSAPSRPIPLRSGSMKIKQILELSHALSGQKTWDELLRTRPAADLSLKFLTPTFFRRRGFNYPMPEPGLVLGSLIAKWNAFAPEAVPESVSTTLTEGVTVRFFSGRTQGAVAHERVVGYLGRVTYHLPDASSKEAAWLARLGELAFFSGVGAKTTLGFGLTTTYQPRLKPRNQTAVSDKNDRSSVRRPPLE